MVAQLRHFDENRLRSFLDDDMPELEQAELNTHLDNCATCQRTLERLAAGSELWADLRQLKGAFQHSQEPSRDATESHDAPVRPHPAAQRDRSLDFLAPSLAPGSLGRLGPYEVTELLGRGGFGVVVKALDPGLNRVVAIKVLAPELATSGAARARFAREARAAAAVVHEHVVAIHSVDTWNNLPYLVMPFVAGNSLQDRVDRDGPLGIREVLRIGMQTALGLAAAHQQGLIHRDVKPSNILLENGVERVKLTDFGLARAVDDASLTQSGVITGTPQYMSPEQARGETVDHRSDLFSLGGVLYFMCAGHPPFRASSTPAVLRRVSDDRPRPLDELNSEIPRWFAEIVEQLHEKDPQRRFSSATEVAELLGGKLSDLQRGVSIPSRPRSSTALVRKFPRTNAVVAAAIIAPILGLLAAGYGKREFLASAMLPLTGRSDAETSRLIGVLGGAGQDERVTIIMDDKAADQIQGSGNPATKTWDIKDFDRVKIATSFRVEITKGPTFKVATTADDNVLPKIAAIKDGTTLRLMLESGVYRLKTPLSAQITLPTLAGLELSGASRATLKGFDSERELTVKLSGSSKVEGQLSVERGEFTIDGASTLTLLGSAGSARLSAHGSSHLNFDAFPIKQAELKLGGASSGKISVKSDAPFKAEVSGSSSLTGSLYATEVVLKLEGASRVTLNGAADRAKIEASGACSVKLPDLILQTADVTLSGASNATVNPKQKLMYHVSSASNLKYKGEPSTIDGSKSGGASVSHAR
jgi:serine/threonine-protein kinase